MGAEAANVVFMRYSKEVGRAVLMWVFCLSSVACANAPGAKGPSGLEQAVAADDDLGDPRQPSEDQPDDEARMQAMLEDPDAERIDFDGDEPNDAPVDMVTIPPDRSPSPSLIQDIIAGPSS